MTRLLDISDLHFGAVNDRLMDPLLAHHHHPQRERPEEFRDAFTFQAGFSLPVITVPGNHDTPLYNLPVRLLSPLAATELRLSPLPQKKNT